MLKLSAIESNEIGEYWEFVDAFFHKRFYSGDYPLALSNFLKVLGGDRILDAACGIGFPALELPRHGIQPDCSDGSESMVKVCQRRAKERDLPLNIFHSRWQDLPTDISAPYNIVLCLDSSITHVDSWGEISEIDIDAARKHIYESVAAFHEILETDGKAVIGLGKYAFDKSPSYEATFDTLVVEGVDVTHTWKFAFDYKKHLKTWSLITKYGGKENIRTYQSYALLPDELKEMMKEAGFHDISHAEIAPGEYDINIVGGK